MITILDGNAFYLRITGKTKVGEYEATLDLEAIDSLIVNFVRRVRESQTVTHDQGKVLAYNDGKLAKGVYGVEMAGYYNGQPWRFYAPEVFEIADDGETEASNVIGSVNVYDVTFYMKLGGDGVTPGYVDAAVTMHNTSEEAHSDMREAITGIRTQVERRLVGAKVTFNDGHTEDIGLGFNDQGEVILLLPKETFGKIDGVSVNGEDLEVDANGKVDIQIPQSVSDLEDADDYATKEYTDARTIENVSATVEVGGEVKQATVTKDGADVHIDFPDLQGQQGVRGNGITSITQTTVATEDGGKNIVNIKTTDNPQGVNIEINNGSTGRPGADRQPVEAGDVIIAHSTGSSEEQVMSQSAVTKEVLPIQDGNKALDAALTGYCIGGQGTVYTNAFTTDYGVTDYLMLDEGQTKVKVVSGAWQRASTDHVIYFYSDKDEEHKIAGEKLSDATTEAVNKEFIVPSNAKYYRLTIKYATPAVVRMKGSLIDKIGRICDVDVTPLALTRNDGYINTSGVITGTSQGKYFYTDPVSVSAGTILRIKIASSSVMTLLSKYVNGTYTPLIIGSGTDIRNVTYIVDEVMDVVFSGYSNKWNNTEVVAVNVNGGIVKDIMGDLDLSNTNGVVRKVKDGIISYDENPLTLSRNNGYVSSEGKILSSGNDSYYYTSPIQVNAGDVVEFYGSSSSVMSAISAYDDGTYTPLAVGTPGTDLEHYSYFAEKSMYVVFSGYSNKIGDSWARKMANYNGDVKALVDANVDMLEKKIETLKPGKEINPISAFNNIVAVGDSLTRCLVYTAGDTRRAYHPWADQIKGEFGLDECLTFARGGWNSNDVWTRLNDGTTEPEGPLRVPENGKTIVFIYLGTNGSVVDELLDVSAPAADVATYETSWANDETGCYCKIIQRFLNFGAKVVLVIPRAGGTYHCPEGWTLDDTRRSVIAVADRFGCAYVDALDCHSTDLLYHKFPDGEGSNSVHYNDFGYVYFKERMIEVLASLPSSLMLRLLPV